jgi:hypothetical protein
MRVMRCHVRSLIRDALKTRQLRCARVAAFYPPVRGTLNQDFAQFTWENAHEKMAIPTYYRATQEWKGSLMPDSDFVKTSFPLDEVELATLSLAIPHR